LGRQDTEGCLKGRLNGASGQNFKFFGCDHLSIVPVQAAQTLATDANPDGAAAANPGTAEAPTRVFPTVGDSVANDYRRVALNLTVER